MRPQFILDYVEPADLYERLRAEVPWVNRDAPRDECFMAAPGPCSSCRGGSSSPTFTASPSTTASAGVASP